MATSTERVRGDGVLNPEDQTIAQRLFEFAQLCDGEAIVTDTGYLTMVSVLDNQARKLQMEIYSESSKHGRITLKLRRGRQSWQDDGAKGYAGAFIAEASILEPEEFHPDTTLRDLILRDTADMFLPLEGLNAF